MRVLLVGEGTLSHGAFLRKMTERLQSQDILAECRTIEQARGVEGKLVHPVHAIGNLDLHRLRWRLRYSWHTRCALLRSPRPDVAFVNTQSCALLAAAAMDRVPTVISVDVTGRQFAAMDYGRARDRSSFMSEIPLEALERRALRRAAAVLAWTDWTARSLLDDYGVPPERVVVAHPGVDAAWWDIERPQARHDRPLQILFVGNEVGRKGLPTLEAALPLVQRPFQLHIVTRDDDLGAPGPNVSIHSDLSHEDGTIQQRFADADVLVLPTLADAVPWVVTEAMAAGLPVIASDVGAIPEMLGDTGVIVARDDSAALSRVLRELADDRDRGVMLGERARVRAREHFFADRQLERIVDVLRTAQDVDARAA